MAHGLTVPDNRRAILRVRKHVVHFGRGNAASSPDKEHGALAAVASTCVHLRACPKPEPAPPVALRCPPWPPAGHREPEHEENRDGGHYPPQVRLGGGPEAGEEGFEDLHGRPFTTVCSSAITRSAFATASYGPGMRNTCAPQSIRAC